MALIKCDECGKQVSDKASACPHCGAPVEKEKTKNNNIVNNDKMNESALWGFILSIISIFFHLIALFSVFICWDALLQFKNKKEKGEGLAIAGAIISAIMLIVMGFRLVEYGDI